MEYSDIKIKRLKENLPMLMKGNQFWEDVLDTVQEEIELINNELQKSEYYLYPFVETDPQVLIDLAKEYGFIISVEITDDLMYVQQYFKSIAYLIKNKGIKKLYDFIFKLAKTKGKVYLLQYKQSLTKLIDYEATINNLPLDKTDDFEIVVANSFFEFYDEQFMFDTGVDFDSGWKFDIFNSTPTQNLAIEYKLDKVLPETVESGDYKLLDRKYLDFAKDVVDNFRKVTTVPMIGAELTLWDNEKEYYDTWARELSIDGKYHSKKESLVDSCVTKYFRNRPELTDMFAFDSGRAFDETAKWKFDNLFESGSLKPIEERYSHVKLGVGSKGLVSKDYPFLERNLLLSIPMNRYDYGKKIIYDEGLNSYDVDINGDTDFVDGEIGKAFHFNGSNYLSINNFNLTGVDKISFSFWLKVDSGDVGEVLFNTVDNNFDFEFVSPDSGYDYKIQFGLDSYTGLSTNGNFGERYFISITTDLSNVSLYKNGALENSQGVTLSTISSSTNLYIGVDTATLNKLSNSTLEEFRIYNRVLTPEEISYMYNNKYGTQASLAKPVYSTELSNDNYWESDIIKYRGIVDTVHAICPANVVKIEIGYVDSSGSITVPTTFPPYEIDTGYGKLLAGSCKLIYTHINGNTISYMDDPTISGIIVGNETDKTIQLNYDTGIISVRKAPAGINPDSIFYLSFGVDGTIAYTEAGIFDNNDNCIAYTTFPKVELAGVQNQMSVSWIIEDPESYQLKYLNGSLRLDGTIQMNYE